MVRLDAPDVTTEERATFEAWVTFPGNRAAYIECRELTPMSGLLRSQPEAAPDLLERIRAPKCASAPRQRRAWYLPVMLAASLVPVIVGLVRQMGSPDKQLRCSRHRATPCSAPWHSTTARSSR